MNEQTALLRLDYEDICDSCGKQLNHKPSSECSNDWHRMGYERWKETSRLNMRRYRALKKAEERFKMMHNGLSPAEYYALKMHNHQDESEPSAQNSA